MECINLLELLYSHREGIASPNVSETEIIARIQSQTLIYESLFFFHLKDMEYILVWVTKRIKQSALSEWNNSISYAFKCIGFLLAFGLAESSEDFCCRRTLAFS